MGILAARKSRQYKNIRALKIGLVIISVSAVVAGLTAFLITRSINSPVTNFADRQSRTMEVDIKDQKSLKSVGEANDMFGGDCFSKMSSGDDGNLLFSPFSASVALSLVAAGAKADTLQQLTSGLHLKDLKSAGEGYHQVIPALRTNDNFTMETGNAAFVHKDYEILSSYRETLHTKFHTDISSVDFSVSDVAAETINSWVSDMTNKKIQQLVEKNMIDATTRLILVNALYFKGDWDKQFDVKKTRSEEFSVSENKKVDVKMIELPYKGDRVVMQIVLPNKHSGLSDVQKKLEEGNVDLNKVFQQEQRKIKIDLKLPKFKLSQSHDLSSVLQDLGMKDMFVAGKADFSGMDGSRNLYVGFVKQDVFVEVNEEGSEAAAATGVGLMLRSMPLPPEQFHVDHPFMFYLRDKLTGMLLFQARVSDPTDN